MPRVPNTTDRSRSNALVSAAIVVAALYFGREILLPFALAILLSFLLAPIVERLEKWKFGRIPAVLATVSAAFLAVAVLAVILFNQVYDLAYRLPDYKKNILAKAEAFQSDGTGVFDRVTKSVDEMSQKLSAPSAAKPDDATENTETSPDEAEFDGPAAGDEKSRLLSDDGRRQDPVPVEVVESLSVGEIAQGIVGPLIPPLATAAAVIVFVIFMLLKREDLRNRLIHLIGGKQLNVTTQAMDDAARRVSRYLLMQLIINSVYGLVICVGLVLIGLPNALLWGAMTAVLRFVPYIGPWIAAIMPLAISLAVFEGWLRPALVFGLFILNELVSNNVVEPWLYGSSTGISTIGIMASAVFWTWIWGPLGLVMATPLTVCLTVVGRYVPQLAFLNTMLSDEDVLPAPERFYQRLLAGDPEEATEVAEEYLAANSLEALYDAVLLPALRLAEQDRHRGDLGEEKLRLVHQTTRDIVEELGERISQAVDETKEAAAAWAKSADSRQQARVLCLPARDDADEIAGLMLVQLLEQRGINARVASPKTLSGEMIEQVEAESAAIVCVSALPPFAAMHARYLSKRLRPRFPQLKIIVGLWQTTGVTAKTQDRLTATGIDKLVTTLSEAASELERLSQNARIAQGNDAPASS